MLIDKTYFTGTLLIPNLSNQNVEDTLTFFIQEKEPQFLQVLFGPLLYADYVAGIAVTPTPDVIWTGLITANIKKAFACFVYCEWMDNADTKTTAEGEVRPAVENGTPASSTRKVVKAWNQIWPLVSAFAVSMDLLRTTYANWPLSYQFFLFQQFKPINRYGI